MYTSERYHEDDPSPRRRGLFAPPNSACGRNQTEMGAIFRPGPTAYSRAPVLLSGPTEALLIDGGFSFPMGRAVADAIKADGKSSLRSTSAIRIRITISA